MDDLFGSDSDNSDGETKSQQLPSTQQHMDELFGDSDEENDSRPAAHSDGENEGSDVDDGQQQGKNESDDEGDRNGHYQSDEDAHSDDNNARQRTASHGSAGSGNQDVSDDNAVQRQQSTGSGQYESDDENNQQQQNSDDENMMQRQQSEGSPAQEDSDDDIPRPGMGSPINGDSDEDMPQRNGSSDDEFNMPINEETSGNRKTSGGEQELDFGNNDEAFFKEMAEDQPNSDEEVHKERTASEKERDDDAFFKEMADDQSDEEPTSTSNDKEKEKESNSDAFFKEMAEDQEDSDEEITRKKPSIQNDSDDEPSKENNDNADEQDDSEDEIRFKKKPMIKREEDSDDDDNKGSDEEDDKRKIKTEDDTQLAAPTTQDLFGEDIDVSSSSDDEPEIKRKPTIEDDDEDDEDEEDEEIKRKREHARKVFDEPERPPTPEKEEGLSIDIELPRCNISLGKELYFIKLPNFLSVDTKPFDPNFYEDEIDEDEIIDEEGKARLKLKVENTIRWRYSKDKDGNEIKESNCRFVRWSDGSLSMHLGNEVFDVFKMPIEGEQNHLFVQQGTGLQAQAVFKNKLSFRPQSTSSQTHQKMIWSIADRLSKSQKIKMMPATEKDPESQREGLLKKEEEFLRSQARRDAQLRKQREREKASNKSSHFDSNYLEHDIDEEEDLDTSLAAIKNRYKQTIKGGPGKAAYDDIYSSDEDSEAEKKIKKAKLESSSDEEEHKPQEPKKKVKKVIEESDDEEESD